jgi:hypothetical protein
MTTLMEIAKLAGVPFLHHLNVIVELIAKSSKRVYLCIHVKCVAVHFPSSLLFGPTAIAKAITKTMREGL